MRIIFFIFLLTCALPVSAQVIDYIIDPSFNSELLLNRGGVSDILLHDDGAILVTGMLNNWDSDAERTSYFSVFGSLLTNVGDGNLHKLQFYLNDYINYGNSGIQRFDLSGQVPPSFNYEFSKPAYSGGLPTRVLDALVMPDDNILVAGRFFTDSTLIGTPISSQGLRQLCMIDSTGAPVPGFPMLRCEWPTDSEINSIRQLSTGEYIISGSFNEVDGHPYPKLAKLNADFSVNTEFEPVFEAGFGEVYTTFIDSQDRLWVTKEPNVVVTADPGFSARIIRILANGNMDETYQTNFFTTYFGSDPNNPTSPSSTGAAILEDTDGTFILGGSFIEVNDEPHNRLIKINDAGEVIDGAFDGLGPDESVWENWMPALGPIAGAYIRVLRKLPDGKLLIGGQFSSFGGEPYSCLVRLQPNGFVGTDDKEGRGKLKIWPNPVGYGSAGFGSAGFGSAQPAVVRITLPNANETIQRVEILDLQGRVVLAIKGASLQEKGIAIDRLTPGVYLLRAGSEKGVYTQKLVVQ